MKINYFSKTLFLVLLLAVTSPVFANTNPVTPHENKEARALALQNRLEEINAIDKEDLTRAEKKVLRREVREIKKELSALSGGVFLSVGAIILIVLLLILLL